MNFEEAKEYFKKNTNVFYVLSLLNTKVGLFFDYYEVFESVKLIVLYRGEEPICDLDFSDDQEIDFKIH